MVSIAKSRKVVHMNGFLLVDKPKGWTSFDVVAKVRNVLRASISKQENSNKHLMASSYLLVSSSKKVRVGHTGTLDPMATGLLVLLIGSYTKKATELSKLDKTYEATLILGATSTTGDSEGTITRHPKPAYFGLSSNLKQKITAVVKSFEGEIEQVPPAYSAIKVKGKRAYKLARQGKAVKIEPRKVKIYSIRDISIHNYISLKSTIVDASSIGSQNVTEVKFTATVSSGTYIRTLAEDIGKALGTGAYLKDLKRTQVGDFNLKEAISPEDKNLLQHISTF